MERASYWGSCSSWLSSTTEEFCPLRIGKGALTQRTGGSPMPWDSVWIAGSIEGSGLRSEGGIRSGLEDVDLLVFWVSSTNCMLREPSPVSSDVE